MHVIHSVPPFVLQSPTVTVVTIAPHPLATQISSIFPVLKRTKDWDICTCAPRDFSVKTNSLKTGNHNAAANCKGWPSVRWVYCCQHYLTFQCSYSNHWRKFLARLSPAHTLGAAESIQQAFWQMPDAVASSGHPICPQPQIYVCLSSCSSEWLSQFAIREHPVGLYPLVFSPLWSADWVYRTFEGASYSWSKGSKSALCQWMK